MTASENRRVLISGASIAGLSAAYWLDRTGWDVTVLERSPVFREGGQNVDVRGVAREVLDRMGLTDAVRAANTTETGTVIVDERGDTIVRLPDDEGGEEATAELEVLRGDFARVIRDALPASVQIEYGQTITGVAGTTPAAGPVTVRTASGDEFSADLLVVAEGVRSSTRDLVFGDEAEQRRVGVTMVFGTIPRIDSDDDRWSWYNAVGGRQVHLRPDNHGTTRAMFAYTSGPDDDPSGSTGSTGSLRSLRDRYADAGWQTPRVLDGFDASDDVYVDDLTQIVAPRWHDGRAVLLGDAAWCVTPMGGGGSSLALTGGYVLAASLSTGEIETGLAGYEGWMRPLVDRIQTMPKGVTTFAYPQTAFGLQLQRAAHHVLTSRPVAPLMARLIRIADADRPLPELVPHHR
ncbi:MULTISPECIES: FAD-dependent monooxygenase [unclassified Curtobacterium]|uniref:FAD-dependent monooxygenase n=1 Tax=unclassified Curtobacterium TaxID=257496 RepID=UPI00381C001A